jgi:hypothetical protein
MSLPSLYPIGYLRQRRVVPEDLIGDLKRAKEQFCETGKLVEAGKWVTLEQLMTDSEAGCMRCFCLHEGVSQILRERGLTGNERLKWHDDNWFWPIVSTDGTAHPDYMFDEAWTDSMVKSGRIHLLEFFRIPCKSRSLFASLIVSFTYICDEKTLLDLRMFLYALY